MLYLTKTVLKIYSMHFKETFGEFVRRLREQKKLPIRKVAAYLDLDPSTLSKIERDERSANREMIKRFSEILEEDEETLLINFLSDKVTHELLPESCSEKVLKVAEQKLKYRKSNSGRQSSLEI